MKAAGFTDEQCASVMHVHLCTLKKHCAKELATGADEANAKLSGKLFSKAFRGDTVALLFWHKTRLGWRETNRTEHTGADGGPIVHETIEAEAAAFTQRIASMADRFATTMASDADEAEPANDAELTLKSTDEAKEA